MRRAILIERVVAGGAGLGRLDGVVTLVEGGLPGDRVLLREERVRPRLLRGRVEEVLEASPARRVLSEVCPRAADGSCGGCDWPAVRLEAHRELKTSLVMDALRRIGRLAPHDVPPPRWIPSPRNYRLRNRLHLDAEGRLGFLAPRSHRISDLVSCEIVSEAFLKRLPAVRSALVRLRPATGELRTLEDREGKMLLGELILSSALLGPLSGEGWIGPFDGFRIAGPDGRTLLQQGPTKVSLQASGACFGVSVSSFFQGNRFLLDPFLQEVRSAVRSAVPSPPGAKALDLFAGVGFLSRPLLEAGFAVTAVESDPGVAKDLEANFEAWRAEGLPEARAVRGRAEAFLARETAPPDLLVADPPRAGLSPSVRRELARLQPEHLLLVSCDPPTFARDVGSLHPAWRLLSLTLLDLFPGTHHVEMLALLGRGRSGLAGRA